MENKTENTTTHEKQALLAGGCFWSMEANLAALQGVLETVVGYAGGFTENPCYRDVCRDITGHVETVCVTYDSDVLSYHDLLEAFFEIHDPTDPSFVTLDYGSQYRSIIFYNNDEEKDTAEQVMAFLSVSGVYDRPINTQLCPCGVFYPAEEYHQHYYQKHGLMPEKLYSTES